MWAGQHHDVFRRVLPSSGRSQHQSLAGWMCYSTQLFQVPWALLTESSLPWLCAALNSWVGHRSSSLRVVLTRCPRLPILVSSHEILTNSETLIRTTSVGAHSGTFALIRNFQDCGAETHIHQHKYGISKTPKNAFSESVTIFSVIQTPSSYYLASVNVHQNRDTWTFTTLSLQISSISNPRLSTTVGKESFVHFPRPTKHEIPPPVTIAFRVPVEILSQWNCACARITEFSARARQC